MPQQPAAEPSGELARLREDLVAFYRPFDSQERLAVERIAMAQQSMLRAARLEASLFASAPPDAPHTILETEAFKVFLRYQAQAERSYRRAVAELMDLIANRDFHPVTVEPASAHRPQPVPVEPASAHRPQPVAVDPASARKPQPAAATPPAPPSPSPSRADLKAATAAARATVADLALRL
jgi:hypothetical protein